MQTDTRTAPSAHTPNSDASHSGTVTRRSLLKAAPAGVIALAVPTAAIGAALPDRSAWNAAMLTHERAKAEDHAFTPTYNCIHAAWAKGRPSMDSIHWNRLVPSCGVDRDHIARGLDLEQNWQRFLDGEGKWWWGGGPEGAAKSKANYRAALDSVQAFRDANARHDRDSGMDEADARWEALGEAANDAEMAIMEMPAPDLAALRWKLDQLLEPESDGSVPSWSRDFVRQAVADYQRLLGGAA